jgi:hypothetical protein
VTMYVLRFLSNATIGTDVTMVTAWGYIREGLRMIVDSCVRELEELGRCSEFVSCVRGLVECGRVL